MSGEKKFLQSDEIPVDIQEILPFDQMTGFDELRNIFLEIINKTNERDDKLKSYFCSLPDLVESTKWFYSLDVLKMRKPQLTKLLSKMQFVNFHYTGNNAFLKQHLKSELEKLFPEKTTREDSLMKFYKTWDVFLYDVYKASLYLEFFFLYTAFSEPELFTIQNSSQYMHENYYKNIIDLFERKKANFTDDEQKYAIRKLEALLNKKTVEKIMATPQWSKYIDKKEFLHPYNLCTFVYGENMKTIKMLYERRKKAYIFDIFFKTKVLPSILSNLTNELVRNPSFDPTKEDKKRLQEEYKKLAINYKTTLEAASEEEKKFAERVDRVYAMFENDKNDKLKEVLEREPNFRDYIRFYESSEANVEEMSHYNKHPISKVGEEDAVPYNEEFFPISVPVNDSGNFSPAFKTPIESDGITFPSPEQYGFFKTCMLFLPQQQEEIKKIFTGLENPLYTHQLSNLQTNLLSKIIDSATKQYFLRPKMKQFFLKHSQYRLIELNTLTPCNTQQKLSPETLRIFVQIFQRNLNQSMQEYLKSLSFKDENIQTYIVDKTNEIMEACLIWSKFREHKIVWNESLRSSFWSALYKFTSSYDIVLVDIPGYSELMKHIRTKEHEFALQYVCKNLLYTGTDYPLEHLSFLVSRPYFQVFRPNSPNDSFVIEQIALQYALSLYVRSLEKNGGLLLLDPIIFQDDEQQESNLISVFSVLLSIFLGIDFPEKLENYDDLWQFTKAKVTSDSKLSSKLFYMATRS
jgi:hypothetical protein